MTCSNCLEAPGVAGKSQFIPGCTSFKKETIQIHATSNGHLRALTAMLAKRESASRSSIAKTLWSGKRSKGDDSEVEHGIFQCRRRVALQQIRQLLALQKKNSVEINHTYANDKSCAEMVSVIEKVFKDQLTKGVMKMN